MKYMAAIERAWPGQSSLASGLPPSILNCPTVSSPFGWSVRNNSLLSSCLH